LGKILLFDRCFHPSPNIFHYSYLHAFDTRVNRPLRYCYIWAPESVLHIPVDYYLSVHNSGKIYLHVTTTDIIYIHNQIFSIILIYTLFYYYYHHFYFYTFKGCIHQITTKLLIWWVAMGLWSVCSPVHRSRWSGWAFDTRVNRPLRYCYIWAPESVLHIPVDYYLSVHNSGILEFAAKVTSVFLLIRLKLLYICKYLKNKVLKVNFYQ
jgi:hypothetical protein